MDAKTSDAIRAIMDEGLRETSSKLDGLRHYMLGTKGDVGDLRTEMATRLVEIAADISAIKTALITISKRVMSED